MADLKPIPTRTFENIQISQEDEANFNLKNYNTFKLTLSDSKKKELRILQLTDMHFFSINPSKYKQIRQIKQICKKFNIDFIINTGDLYCTNPPFFAKHIINIMNSIEIPWAFAWGNHDCEVFKFPKKFKGFDILEDHLESLSHCVYRKTREYIENYGDLNIEDDPNEVEACLDPLTKKIPYSKYDGFYGGNYRIQVVSPNMGKPVWDLFILNSRRWHGIPQKALVWMKDTMDSNPEPVPAMAFYHVPNYQFHSIWDKNIAKGIKGERICFEGDRGRIHNFFKTLPSLKACFVGHDHVNDYYGEIDGIHYVYGRKSSIYSYGCSDKLKENFVYGNKQIRMGAKLITLNLDNNSEGKNWSQISVFPDGTEWFPDKMEDMGTVK